MKSPSEQGRSGISTLAEYASHEFRQAEKLEKREAFDRLDGHRKLLEAERARADGERLLQPLGQFVGDAATEIVPAIGEQDRSANGRRSMVCI